MTQRELVTRDAELQILAQANVVDQDDRCANLPVVHR